jgi:F-type H+-transporting ATPase subunit b
MTMHFGWSTFALQTVNFAILVWLLHRFLYKPVLRLIDARRGEIDKQYADAKAAEAQAETRLAAVQAEREKIAGERASALKQAAAQAEEQAAARRAQAERDAAAVLAGAHKSLADERALAVAEARRAALDLGADIAGRLLAQVPMKLRAEAWIDRIEHHLAGLPKPEVEALARQVGDGVPLKITTASTLPPEAADLWRSRLRQILGDDIPVDYGVDPGLVAGAELHFPNAILRFSWQSALDAMRAEIESDGNAR